MVEITEIYSDDYKESCFYAWYKAGKPKISKDGGNFIVSVVPAQTSNGVKPYWTTIRQWYHKYNWEARADALDAELSRKLDLEAIEERAKLYREIAGKGRDMMNLGYEHITENGFDTSASAVRAIFGGAEMVAKFGNAADILLAVHAMSNKQILSEIDKLLGGGETIDVEPEDVTGNIDDADDES